MIRRQKFAAYKPYQPTADEIAEACRKFREGWSEDEMRVRVGLPRDHRPLTVTEVRWVGVLDGDGR